MPSSSRIALGIAALILAVMYVTPIWKISLDAPQYPEGLGMYIRINDVTGEGAHDLTNINNLNHYIGMKRIEPESIPELRIMPWVIGALIGLGLLAAAIGRPWALYTWVTIFAIVAIVGLVDFYLWEYDYGHNLDQEHAIIKIPGMNYQPPLIGSKQLLNFTAQSWPAIGGWIAFASLGLGLVLAVRVFRAGRVGSGGAGSLPVALAFLPLLLMSCANGPTPIRYGEDGCAHCLMTISDERYGTELVTSKGKAYLFDSIECLAAWIQIQDEPPQVSLWVTDFAKPGTLLPVEEALILRSPNLRSPMGMNLTAFGAGMTPEAATNAFAGEILTWNEVLAVTQEHARGLSTR